MWYPRQSRGWMLTAAFAAVLVAGPLIAPRAVNAAELTEHIYAYGKVYTINTEAAVQLEAPSGVLPRADAFYIIGFPVPPGTTGPITLPSGYEPQNNGRPAPMPYHDHITGDVSNPIRHVIELRYTWAYAYNASFVPLTSVDQLPAAEASGKLEVVAPGASDPYQHWTSTVLVRPVVP